MGKKSEDEEWEGDSVYPVVKLGCILFFNFKLDLKCLCPDM